MFDTMMDPLEDLSCLDGAAALDLLRHCHRVVAQVQAVGLRAVARLVECSAGHEEFVQEEIANELLIGPGAASEQLSLADALTTRLPRTLDALGAGDIDWGRMKAIVDLASPLTDEQAGELEGRIYPTVTAKHSNTMRDYVRRQVRKVDPLGADQRAQERRQSRRVELLPDDDGMSWLRAYLLAETALAIYMKINAIANQLDDDRCIDEKRADVYADLILNPGKYDVNVATQVQVFVTLDATTLLGLNDLGAELSGHGPIPADGARELAFSMGATWHGVLTDPDTGEVERVARRRYRPSTELAQKVRLRDRHCQFPGCRVPSYRCDLDHVVPFRDGGETCEDTLHCLCRRHHRLKHTSGWTVHRNPNTGETTWNSPHNRTYQNTPEPPPSQKDDPPPPF
ncbi:MAG: DUF222 domain-containing protein [Sciscionella sp.]